MEKIIAKSALYIKLGRRGKYEETSLTSPGHIHIGWNYIPHELCQADDWEAIKQLEITHNKGNLSTATNQTNQLRKFYGSGEDVLWITFYNGKLYWCFAKRDVIPQPDKSRIRQTLQGWYDCDIQGNQLYTSCLSGSLLAIQGFRSVICKVSEFHYLLRKINGEESKIEKRAKDAQKD
jgi:hypothetical protein